GGGSDGESGGSSDLLYDLYSVVNHMGGLSGGHYTACCLSTPCSPGGIEDAASVGYPQDSRSPPWLYFDDEFVEELPPARVVSEAAYVLFYKRRRVTGANLVNTTV
ncbi:hypothetical protein JKP88DRAFT_166310, partial [Tribonema minus]